MKFISTAICLLAAACIVGSLLISPRNEILMGGRDRLAAINIKTALHAIEMYRSDHVNAKDSRIFPKDLDELVQWNYLHDSDLKNLQHTNTIYFPPQSNEPSQDV